MQVRVIELHINNNNKGKAHLFFTEFDIAQVENT